MTRPNVDLQLAGTPLHAVADEVLMRELDRTAERVLTLDFLSELPRGSRELMLRFWPLSAEIDRRGLPASVAVERSRFMFPPL